METEVEDWLKNVAGTWVQRQEEKHGVPADYWLSHIHHLTKQHTKLSVGLNSWNCFQKWWKHCHPGEEDGTLGPEEGTLGPEAGKSFIISISMSC